MSNTCSAYTPKLISTSAPSLQIERNKNYVQPQQRRNKRDNPPMSWSFSLKLKNQKTHPQWPVPTKPNLETASPDENLHRELEESKEKRGVWIPCRVWVPTGRAGPQFEKPGNRREVARAKEEMGSDLWSVCVCASGCCHLFCLSHHHLRASTATMALDLNEFETHSPTLLWAFFGMCNIPLNSITFTSFLCPCVIVCVCVCARAPPPISLYWRIMLYFWWIGSGYLERCMFSFCLMYQANGLSGGAHGLNA